MGETVIIRHKREKNFTVLSNVPLRDCRLSWKAKGLLAYLLSLSEAYQLRVDRLVGQATDGRNSTRTGLTQLQSLGYLRILHERGSHGRFSRTTWMISEAPEAPQEGVDSPQSENQTVVVDHKPENRIPVKPTSTTEELVVIKTTTTNDAVNPVPPPSLPPQLLERERVVVVQLINNLEQPLAQALLDELEGAIAAGKIRTSRVAYFQAMVRRAESGTFVPAIGLMVAERRAREARRTTERADAAASGSKRTNDAVAQANIAAIQEALRRSA